MTANPSMYYRCDRCLDECYVPARTNPPEHKRMAGPEGWLQIKVGDDPSEPPKHLCPPCAFGFNAYMADKTIKVGDQS